MSEYESLDIKDMAIFNYIHTMCASVNPRINKERIKGHTWINYERLIEDMPALRIKSRNSISLRITKLEESGFIKTLKKMVNGHRRVFVKLTTQSDSVFVENTERVLSHEKRVRENVQDNNTIDNTTKDNNTYPLSYLENLSVKEANDISKEYNCTRGQVQEKAQAVILYCESNGKRYKNYRSTLKGWLLRDYGKKEKQVWI